MSTVSTATNISRSSGASSSVATNVASLVLPPVAVAAVSVASATYQQFQLLQHSIQNQKHEDFRQLAVPQGQFSSGAGHSSEGLVAVGQSQPLQVSSTYTQIQHDSISQIMRAIGNTVHQCGSILGSLLKLVASIFISGK